MLQANNTNLPPVARRSRVPRPSEVDVGQVDTSTTSEQALLRLDEAQYMGREQLAFFRARLEEMRRQLKSKTVDEVNDGRVAAPDPVDRASMEESKQLELRARGRDMAQLAAIDAALKRIDDGSYGWCEDSGDAIGLPRLLANPIATLTFEAQNQLEKRGRMFNHA